MKIKLKDLSPNPYKKHINGGKLNKEKVDKLKESIEKDGFWDNVICRKNNGTYEIAYGHHRLEAAKQVLGKDYEVDIPVKQLTDDNMARILSNENSMQNEEYAVYQVDTVLFIQRYLKEHPQISDKWKSEQDKGHGQKPNDVISIARFLGEKNWSKSKVAELLQIHKRLDPSILAEMKNAPSRGGSLKKGKPRPFTVAHAYEIARIPDKEKQKAAMAVVKKDRLTSEQTRDHVNSILYPPIPVKDVRVDKMIEAIDKVIKNEEAKTLLLKISGLTDLLKHHKLNDYTAKEQFVLCHWVKRLQNELHTFIGGKNALENKKGN